MLGPDPELFGIYIRPALQASSLRALNKLPCRKTSKADNGVIGSLGFTSVLAVNHSEVLWQHRTMPLEAAFRELVDQRQEPRLRQ